MADGTGAMGLVSFTIWREHGSAHVCFIRPDFERADVDDVVLADFAGEGSVVFEACFEGARTGCVECEESTVCVRCFAVT